MVCLYNAQFSEILHPKYRFFEQFQKISFLNFYLSPLTESNPYLDISAPIPLLLHHPFIASSSLGKLCYSF